MREMCGFKIYLGGRTERLVRCGTERKGEINDNSRDFVCLVWFGFFFASKYGFFGLGPSPSRDPPPAGQKRGQPESRWQMAPASSSRLTVWTPRPALASPLWERDGRRGRAQRKRVQEPRSEKRRQRVRSGPEKRKKPDRWRQEDKI